MARPPRQKVESGATCVAATRRTLEELNQSDSPEGQAALALAAAIDSGMSLMAVPAMVKELRATLDALRAITPKAGDGVDEFTARRAARRAAAGL